MQVLQLPALCAGPEAEELMRQLASAHEGGVPLGDRAKIRLLIGDERLGARLKKLQAPASETVGRAGEALQTGLRRLQAEGSDGISADTVSLPRAINATIVILLREHGSNMPVGCVRGHQGLPLEHPQNNASLAQLKAWAE